jgi:hypothetical protein
LLIAFGRSRDELLDRIGVRLASRVPIGEGVSALAGASNDQSARLPEPALSRAPNLFSEIRLQKTGTMA